MTLKREAEKAPGKERYPQRLLTYRDLQGVLANNRTTLILNANSFREHFDDDGSKFDPALCHPIRLVDVRQYDGTIMQGLEDGNHRAIAGELYGRGLDPEMPYLPSQNVTKQFSEKPLSPERFMDVLIAPTKAQGEIAPERMAYITLTQWEQMVGPELASKFSLLAALTAKDISDDFFWGNTPEEKNVLKEKIKALHDTLAKADYISQEMRGEVLTFLSQQDNTALLDPRIRKQQIAGLMLLPPVHQKLADEFGTQDTPTKRQAQETLVNHVLAGLTSFKEDNEDGERRAIIDVLLNPTFPHAKTLAVVRSPFPKSTAKAYTTTIKRDRLATTYKILHTGGGEIPTHAQGLLIKFRHRDEDPKDITKKVAAVSSLLEHAYKIREAVSDPEKIALIDVAIRAIKYNSTYDTIDTLANKLKQAINVALRDEEPLPLPPEDPAGIIQTLTARVDTLTNENRTLEEKITALQTENTRLSERERALDEEATRLQQLLKRQAAPVTDESLETVVVELAPIADEPAGNLPSEPESTKHPAAATTSTPVFTAPVTDRPSRADHDITDVVPTNWKTVTYRDPEGTKLWFGQHFAAGKNVEKETRQKTTVMISKHARMLLRYPPEEWEETLNDIQLKTGEIGLDAIDKVLTPRFGRLMHDVAWGPTNDEFSYLAAASFIRFLQTGAENISETDSARALSIQQTVEIMNEELHNFKPAMFDGNRKAYAALIQVLLFGHPHDQARTGIIQSMRGNRMDTISARNKLAQLVDIRDPSVKNPDEAERILGALFRRHVLGEKPPTSDPDPDTFQ